MGNAKEHILASLGFIYSLEERQPRDTKPSILLPVLHELCMPKPDSACRIS
jgi:hypothetical protein